MLSRVMKRLSSGRGIQPEKAVHRSAGVVRRGRGGGRGGGRPWEAEVTGHREDRERERRGEERRGRGRKSPLPHHLDSGSLLTNPDRLSAFHLFNVSRRQPPLRRVRDHEYQ